MHDVEWNRLTCLSVTSRYSPIALISEERAAELREVLREMLIEFLELCRHLVLKTRTVLNVPKNAPSVMPSQRAVGEERTQEEVCSECVEIG